MNTEYNIEIDNKVISEYFDNLVGRFYKILPLKEGGEKSYLQYVGALIREMLGFKTLVPQIGYDDRYLSLVSTLEYILKNDPSKETVKSDVFKSINLIKRIKNKHCRKGE